ncbi:MAG: nucleotidyltransferase domain-containing protein, partial [Chloroflexi bacterium]|nr:nucleotidyltransferase domain-containing protein [Chloroflexota bacterium]
MDNGQIPYPDVNQLLDRLQPEIRQIFRERLVGLYLYGSVAAGDYDPGISDVDLLALVESEVTEPEFDALLKMHRQIAREIPEWDDRVEVIYLPVTALETFRTKTCRIAVISPGEPFHMKDADRGYLMNWY